MGSNAKEYWHVGDTIQDRYLLEEQIGLGSMGAVYRARDLKLDKIVAVKTLTGLEPDDEHFVRFHREAKIASQIDHPNIVKTYDFGVYGNNQPYLVMELLDGIELKQFIEERGPVNVAFGLNILKQICEGMRVVHAEGIIHRDLKTSNIMMMDQGENGFIARLLDFGAARTYSSEDGSLTQTGLIVGTPKYLSPEQALGIDLDERSDIYSLGCIAYELFCGKPPFLGETAMATIEMHLEKEPAPLSSYRDDLVPGLEELILKMMSKDPDDRIQSMSELKNEIEGLQQIVSASSFPEEPEAKEKKESGSTAATLAACIILLVGIVYGVTSVMKPPSKAVLKKQEKAKQEKIEKEFKLEKKERKVTHEQFDLFQEDPKSFVILKSSDAEQLKSWAKEGATIPCFITDGYKLTDEDVDNIVAIKPSWILLSRAGVQDRHLEKLSKCQSIEELKLCKNLDVTIKGVNAVKNLAGLKQLSLRWCNIDDACMKPVSEMKTLTLVDLEYNPKLTLKGLMQLTKLPDLKSVGIYKTGIKLTEKKRLEVQRELGVDYLFTKTTFDTPKAFRSMDAVREKTKIGGIYNHTGALYRDMRVYYGGYTTKVKQKRKLRLD